MRPLRLVVKGFTAFRDPAEIDFTGLDVFAVSGATGSGKSSVLDAMTYALYGRVERVGDHVSQLISQGQPSMSVTLEFEVGRDRYRLTRRTSAKGLTKIMLEELTDGEWKQAGEGSDKVRDVEQALERIIGLKYDGFTRSVLLPQGRFAEFLVGDPSKRRDILTQLLGLSLFKRMAERAGSTGKEAQLRAQERGLTLEREYADAIPEALKEAVQAVKAAQKREKALSGAGQKMLEILGRWNEAKRSAEELRACAEEAAVAAEYARGTEGELAELDQRAEEVAASLVACTAESEAALEAQEQALATLREAESEAGSRKALEDARVRAHGLAEAVRTREDRQTQLEHAALGAQALREGLEAAEAALAEQAQAFAEREAECEEAQAALEDARHADLVAAVSAGLKAGDACPVCGLPLAEAPKKAASGALKRATMDADKAKQAMDGAGKEWAQAERAVAAARRDVEHQVAQEERLANEVRELQERIAEDQAELAGLIAAAGAGDPLNAVEAQLERLRGLEQAEREAEREVAARAQAVLQAQGERDLIAVSGDRLRDRLAADRQPLLDRAARAVGRKAAPVSLPPAPAAGALGELRRYASNLATALETFAGRLAAEVQERRGVEQSLLQEALQATDGLIEPADSLESLARAVDAACRQATAEVATSGQHADSLRERLERKRTLSEEVNQLEGRAVLFKRLAQELRADHLIAFLQAEALQLLAAAGSVRLQALSEGRYRITCRDDEFSVVDMWNGDEERSVRTLSGGETFLASLALALALSEQVRSLSVTEKARLDSLFLDEGFGTLDPESLRTVVDAIEQLGGDGRLVGVITHVRDLAEQFPRLEVTKSPRGSRVTLIP